MKWREKIGETQKISIDSKLAKYYSGLGLAKSLEKDRKKVEQVVLVYET